LRISGQRLNELTDKGIIRRGTDQNGQAIAGRYRFDVAVGDYLEYQARQARGSGQAVEIEKAKMLAVKRQVTEMKLAAMNGAFVEVEDAIEVFAAVSMRIRSKLASVLSRLVRSVYHAPSIEEGQARAEGYFDEVLSELSRLRAKDLSKPKLKLISHAHAGKDTEQSEED
jgi:hypothetical protein